MLLTPLTDILPSIKAVASTPVEMKAPFVEMAARFAPEAGTVVLLSGGDLDCSRYHLLGIRPWLTLVGWPGRTTVIFQGKPITVRGEPLDVLEVVYQCCRIRGTAIDGPVGAGLFGYLSYDLKDGLERLPRTAIDDLGLPLLYVCAPSLIVVEDKVHATVTAHGPLFDGGSPRKARQSMDAWIAAVDSPTPMPGRFSNAGKPLVSNFTRSDYLRAVQQIRAYIAAGDVYQVNLSQRFETGFSGDSYALFQQLYAQNPAPFFAYVNAGNHQVVSTSPERFVQQTGRRVETRPIKGTRPRGSTPEEERTLRTALSTSPKDDAELSMIVDLLRNDIGKVCSGGSVTVSQHKRLETYRNVYHLVSVIEGELAAGKNSVDLIRATFPGGSITGCPKIRSMEIIDELESRRRHIYTGAIGYISFHDTMDLSIAIRTATIVGNRLVFSVGGGIVFDSDPQDEFEETLHKGKTLMTAFKHAEDEGNDRTRRIPWIWLSGRLVPQNEAAVSLDDLGLQYGYGFFETLRVDNGRPCRLSAHLKRFNRAWTVLFGGSPPDLTWKDIIAQVIEQNGLSEKTAAVKIIATRGNPDHPECPGALAVMARAYTHRLKVLGTRGLKLATYPHPRMTPLADHKTLNYLYYHRAGIWARENRADEAVILNPDGSLSETNTANLLVIRGRTAFNPISDHVLPGVMHRTVCNRLTQLGFLLQSATLYPKDLTEDALVVLTNALMGAVSAEQFDGRPLRQEAGLIAALNQDDRSAGPKEFSA